jgi:hypothetical protein
MPEAEVDYTYGLPKLPGGRAYNQKKRGLSKFIRTVGMAVKPLNKNLKPIKEALANRMVEEIEASGHPKGSAKAHVAMARLRRLKAAKRAPMTMEQAMAEMDSGESVARPTPKKRGRPRKIVGEGYAHHTMLKPKKINGKRPSIRNMIVKRVMAEQGLSLIEASSYVKKHNLYVKDKKNLHPK